MDKKERKRDIATFSNMMKELMQKDESDVLSTLDRDIQHFVYGRLSLMVKHNEGKPIGSLADISAVVGAALADIVKEFVRGRSLETGKVDELFDRAEENLVKGFQARRPVIQAQVEEVNPRDLDLAEKEPQ
jgi:hypothetical protein